MIKIQFFDKNKVGRDFVVGDLHGELDQFHRLLSDAGFNEKADRVFSVGDLMDRGSKSMECIRLLENDWFHSVRGNHEQMMIDAMTIGDQINLIQWFGNGGQWSMGHQNDELQDLLSLVQQLPFVIVVGDEFAVLHAEFTGSADDLMFKEYSKHEEAELMWGRSIIKDRKSPHEFPFNIYCGHSIVGAHTNIGQFNFIDTGAFLAGQGDGYLTMIEPATGMTWATSKNEVKKLDWDNE